MLEMIQTMDWKILYWIHSIFSCSFLDYWMPKISSLGNVGFIWIVIGIILLMCKQYRKDGIMFLSGLLAGVLIGNVMLKNVIARPRPCWIDDTIQLLIANPTDYSFPSGHTLASTIGATILVMINRKFGRFAIPMALAIAFSRLYLFVHFPSDIIGAGMLGVVIGIVTVKVFRKLAYKEENQSKKKPAILH